MNHQWLIEKRIIKKVTRYVPVYYCQERELYFGVTKNGTVFSSNCLDLLLSDMQIEDYFFREQAFDAMESLKKIDNLLHEFEFKK